MLFRPNSFFISLFLDVIVRLFRTSIPLLILHLADADIFGEYIYAMSVGITIIAYVDLGSAVLSVKKMAKYELSISTIFIIRIVPLIIFSTCIIYLIPLNKNTSIIIFYVITTHLCELIFSKYRIDEMRNHELFWKTLQTFVTIIFLYFVSNLFISFLIIGILQILWMAVFILFDDKNVTLDIKTIKNWFTELIRLSAVYLITPFTGSVFILITLNYYNFSADEIGVQFMLYNIVGIVMQTFATFMHSKMEREGNNELETSFRAIIILISLMSYIIIVSSVLDHLVNVYFLDYKDVIIFTLYLLPISAILQFEILCITIKNVVKRQYIKNFQVDLISIALAYVAFHVSTYLDAFDAATQFVIFIISYLSIKLAFHKLHK